MAWEAANLCVNQTSGFVPRHTADNTTEIVECRNGTEVAVCQPGWVRAGPGNNTCIDPASVAKDLDRSNAAARASAAKAAQAAYADALQTKGYTILCGSGQKCFCEVRVVVEFCVGRFVSVGRVLCRLCLHACTCVCLRVWVGARQKHNTDETPWDA